eukprot:4007828-Pleurochrysis_carterae.AAC.10
MRVWRQRDLPCAGRGAWGRVHRSSSEMESVLLASTIICERSMRGAKYSESKYSDLASQIVLETKLETWLRPFLPGSSPPAELSL